MPKREKKSLGEALVELGLIDAGKLKKAKSEVEKTKEPLRRVLVKLGMVDEDAILSFFEGQMGVPRIDFSNYILDPKVVELLPETFCRKNSVLPLFKIADTLTIAMTDPMDVFTIDEVRARTRCEVEPVVVSDKDLQRVFGQYYGAKGTMDDIVKSIDKDKLALKEGAEPELKALEGLVEEAPVVRLVNLVVMEALKAGASDIHIEPEEESLLTRYRIDGVLHEVVSPPKNLQAAVISR
ncbi:MAG TPA: ATPase, T2SS/T4P/T4SS family, partial [Candidatus Omnitrophota bacterium]|nr:ATPase, T2SS/T4P/T4SS family [Candidatus Omnitrophota bacterium]